MIPILSQVRDENTAVFDTQLPSVILHTWDNLPYLEPDVKTAAVQTILESLEVLTPVFTSVMLLLKDIVRGSNEEVSRNVFCHYTSYSLRNLR